MPAGPGRAGRAARAAARPSGWARRRVAPRSRRRPVHGPGAGLRDGGRRGRLRAGARSGVGRLR
ncbi:hypothetical protein EEB14_59790 [Rhodococcus sp. WS4]|nr:hypothetical protein EEB14_59790 [Rhodococcus sp. WS4]